MFISHELNHCNTINLFYTMSNMDGLASYEQCKYVYILCVLILITITNYINVFEYCEP